MMLSTTLLATLALNGIGLPASDTLRYRMFDLGPGQTGREAGLHCNSSGWVLADPMNGRGWFWRPGIGWRQFPPFTGYRIVQGFAINDRGTVALRVATDIGIADAAVWSETKGYLRIQRPPNFGMYFPKSINQRGEVVGIGTNGTVQDDHGWYWAPGMIVLRDLGSVPNGRGPVARVINDTGDVAGSHIDGNRIPALHLWKAHEEFVNIGHPASGGAHPTSLNIHGDMGIEEGTVGMLKDARWADGTYVDLGFAPGTSQQWSNYSMNDSRWIIGNAVMADGKFRAMIWRPGFNTQYVSDLVDSSADGYRILQVFCITNNGIMSGSAEKPGDRRTRPILLVPYPKKSSGG